MNETSLVIKERISTLQVELDREIAHQSQQARWQGWVLKLMMLVTVGSSIVAGIGGLVFHWTSEIVGLIAFLPGIMAFLAGTLKVPERVSRHARFRDGLRGLKHRLLLEMPEHPTVDNIASISREMRELRDKMAKEVEHFAFNWNQFKDDRVERGNLTKTN